MPVRDHFNFSARRAERIVLAINYESLRLALIGICKASPMRPSSTPIDLRCRSHSAVGTKVLALYGFPNGKRGR